MDEPAVLYPSLIADTSLRLQQLVNGWRGAERGEPLTALHYACVNAVGPGGRQLVPAHVLLVPDLDVTNLQEETGEQSTEGERQLKRVQAIRERLGELVKKLQENLQQGD